MRPPSGQQLTISSTLGGVRLRATVTEVAAGLRELVLGDVDLVEPFREDARPAKGQGIVMAPWGGRVRDGRWTLDGAPQQLALTEPALGNASHGLLRYAPYRVLDHGDAFVLLQATIHPQPGFPFLLDTFVRYEVDDTGLTVTHEAVNAGPTRAPWACGAHPYLAVGATPADALTLTVPAASALIADERLLPVRTVAVDDADAPAGADLRAGRRLSELDLDLGLADVAHVDGIATSTLLDDAGRGVRLWQDSAFGYAVVFTPRDFPGVDGVHQAVAVEPMSAPADALNSGEGLVWLEPGETWTGRWGVAPVGLV
ncbi:aldose 1-epimerase family protein [Agrococcus jejuensis]|uniref:aldose 1-epimerase family protein n=1 Tax=Agrococcus jejuensis TaxID=399736 RepID=UPI0021B692B3|nr:aldose 1-epimerase family protein [Agrococcus jejuensis]